MKRYRSIDYGRVIATANDPLIATHDSPRDAVPIALAAEPAVETTYTAGIGWQYVDRNGRHGNYSTQAEAVIAGCTA